MVTLSILGGLVWLEGASALAVHLVCASSKTTLYIVLSRIPQSILYEHTCRKPHSALTIH